MHRSKAERRHNDWMKIRRKARIIKEVWEDKEWYNNFWKDQKHRLSKSKIHCSCPLCAAKTRIHGPTLSDYKQFERLQSSLDEAEFNMKILPHRGW